MTNYQVVTSSIPTYLRETIIERQSFSWIKNNKKLWKFFIKNMAMWITALFAT